NNLFAGKGLLCQVKYKQLGGYKPNIIKNKEAFPTINAWIATFPSAIPGRNYVVPLRLWVDSSFGVISVVATSLKIDGQPVESSWSVRVRADQVPRGPPTPRVGPAYKMWWLTNPEKLLNV